MMHYVLTQDDVRPYCSDACAREDADYDGWYGAQEGADYPEYCARCGVRASVGLETDCDGSCVPVVVNLIAPERGADCPHGYPSSVIPLEYMEGEGA